MHKYLNYHILESIQYGFLYLFAAFIGGVSLDYTFPHYDEDKPTREVLYEVILQCLALVIIVYFIRSVVKTIPFMFSVRKNDGFIPYKTSEYNGEMMMGFVFLGCQLNLVQKIDLLARKLYSYIFNEERVFKADLIRKS